MGLEGAGETDEIDECHQPIDICIDTSSMTDERDKQTKKQTNKGHATW